MKDHRKLKIEHLKTLPKTVLNLDAPKKLVIDFQLMTTDSILYYIIHDQICIFETLQKNENT